MKIFFLAASVVLIFSEFTFAKKHTRYIAAVDPVQICSAEAQKRLLKLELKGEIRFSEIKIISDSMTSSNVEFTELGANKRQWRRTKRRKQKKEAPPAKQQFGQLLVIKALGKEKTGWRNLSVRCGINKGRLATFTYEILKPEK